MNATRLPNFLIVGTMKSGTTTLASYLKQNQDIHIPNEELHYFNNEDNYQKGPGWYSQRLTEGITESERHLLYGEKTPGYSYLPYCAQRVKDLIPDVKLVWIFRDPVKRAYSNYLHNKRKGFERRSFPYCILHEKERMQQDPIKGYIERSKYILQVERFAKLFKLEDMHFLLFEDLICSPLEELNRLSVFLKIQPFQNLKKQHSNKTWMPLSSRSLYVARKLWGSDSKIFNATNKMNARLARIWPRKQYPIADNLSSELRNQLRPYNQRLQELTGLDLSSWEPTSD